MFHCLPLFAEGAARTVFQWGRIESRADWLLPLGACVALGVLARYMIRLDTRELRPRVGWLLTALRTGTLFCLLVIFLQPQWRSEREVVRNSRVLLLVDTSSSMGLTDVDWPVAAGGVHRAQQVAGALDRTGFLHRLRQTHDVVVSRFDEDVHRVVSLEKLSSGRSMTGDAPNNPGRNDSPRPAGQTPGLSGRGPEAVSDKTIDWQTAFTPTGTQTRLGEALRHLIHAERGSPLSGVVVLSDGGQNAGISPDVAVEAAQEAKIPIFTVGVGSTQRSANVRVYKLEVPPRAHPGDPFSVTAFIQAHGLAGRTVTVQLLMRDAGQAGAGHRREALAAEPGSGIPVQQKDVVLGAPGEVVPVKFELTPAETGRRTISVRVRAPEADTDPADDFQEEEIEIVDRKTRVLLFAGGPTREYRFLRTQLYRDASTTLDVLLQTGLPGISQEGDQILDDFPATREAMYAYDCVVAFDPNWQTLTPGQVDLLEGWVGEQGGGLIVVPGPVHAGESISGWVEDPDLGKIRALYPVEFQRRLSALEHGTYVSNEPWPLDFTREGLEAEFLWLDQGAAASQRAWAGLAGVYSCFPARRPKPGATVLARFSDPRAVQSDRQPVYFAEQFYGSGRVFYLASGEMWRLRRIDEAHFERFYTGLIRHVSQGRLLRQSSRGTLMVGRDRHVLGDTVEIRARLTSPQLEPLEAAEVPLQVIQPDGSVRAITLRPDPGRAGVYAAELSVLAEGVYRLELPVPESDDERLTRRIQVRLPDLERENPQRNDKLLSRIAQRSGGKYYPKLDAALDPDARDPLVRRLKDRTRTVIQTASLEPPSLRWLLEQHLPRGLRERAWFSWLVERAWVRKPLEQTVVWWLMIVTCSLLCCEWLIRRLSKLA